MYRNRENFKEKEFEVDTPEELSNFIFNKLKNFFPDKNSFIFDPCVGKGNLLNPWKKAGYKVFGIDIKEQGFQPMKKKDYLEMNPSDISPKPDLILINPPFSKYGEKIWESTKNYLKDNNLPSRPFFPEVFLNKTIELFGKDTPIVLFTPYGMRLNITHVSKRYKKFVNQHYPKVVSIISLPKNVYNHQNGKGILFHSEILIFNLPYGPRKIEPHYFF